MSVAIQSPLRQMPTNLPAPTVTVAKVPAKLSMQEQTVEKVIGAIEHIIGPFWTSQPPKNEDGHHIKLPYEEDGKYKELFLDCDEVLKSLNLKQALDDCNWAGEGSRKYCYNYLFRKTCDKLVHAELQSPLVLLPVAEIESITDPRKSKIIHTAVATVMKVVAQMNNGKGAAVIENQALWKV